METSGFKYLRRFVLFFVVLVILGGCAPSYERYMQEGNRFLEQKDYEKAKTSFHKAVMEARKDKKKSERLIDALLAERDCAVALQQYDSALNLLSEAASVLEKNTELKRAAGIRKQMGDLALGKSNADAENNYSLALTDLQQAGLEKSHETALVLLSIADYNSMQLKDKKTACKTLEKSIKLMDEIGDQDNHTKAGALHKLAFIYGELNRENDQIAADERAKTIEIAGVKGSVYKMLPKLP